MRACLAGATSAGDANVAWRNAAVDAVLANALIRHGIPLAARDALAKIVWRTLTEAPALTGPSAQLVGPLVRAAALWRELEFTYPLAEAGEVAPDVVRGVLDALVRWDDAVWIVDYKSDLLGHADPVAARRLVEDRYRTQAALYGLAGARIHAQWPSPAPRFAGLLYWFVRDQIVVPIEATPSNLTSWRQWLAQQGTR